MPIMLFRYPCCGTGHGGGARICSTHQAQGVWDGWHYAQYEAMHRYAVTRLLTPTGPHRRFADELLDPLWLRCGLCEGRGLVGTPEAGWGFCPICSGWGGSWQSTLEFKRVRAEILRHFPKAACEPESSLGP